MSIYDNIVSWSCTHGAHRAKLDDIVERSLRLRRAQMR